MVQVDEVRVFVGGLPAGATARELRERFAAGVEPPCTVSALELLPSKAPWAAANEHRGSAFLTITGDGAEAQRERLVKTYHRTKWRGSVLRVEAAKPHYLATLRQEWKDREEKRAASAKLTTPSFSGGAVKAAVKFTGKRTTEFSSDVESEDDVGGSTSEEEEEVEEEEEQDEGEDGEDSGDSSQEEEAINEDDIEQFVRQVQMEESDDDDEEEAVDEDDVEQFVRRVQQEQDLEPMDEEAARAEANARRVAALAARQQQKEQQKQQQLAAVTGVKGKKITFDDDGEAHEGSDDDGGRHVTSGERVVTDWMESDSEAENDDIQDAKLMDPEDRERLQAASAKTGKKTLDFLGDDDKNDGDSKEQEEAVKAFALRPEFLGSQGKKLFEMQKRFGGDQRFRLDARFMEDDDANEFGGMGDEGDDVGEGNTGEGEGAGVVMQSFLDEDGDDDEAERDRVWRLEQDEALAAIERLFPDLDIAKIKYRLREKAKKDPIKEASWMGRMKRYDPRDAHSRQEFELPMENKPAAGRDTIGADHAEDEAARRKAERENKEVLVGGDRFFATSSSLGNMFTRVRKNSEDGEAGEAALDGVFGFNVASESGAGEGDAGGSTFKLSSLFDFPVEDEATIASIGESLLENDDDTVVQNGPNEPWHFSHSLEDDKVDDELGEMTDDEGDDGVGDDGEKKKKKAAVFTKIKKSLEDFLAFGRSFVGGDAGKNDKDWAERRKKLTLDFKRKRRDALKNKKKQQQQFAKHKKARRS